MHQKDTSIYEKTQIFCQHSAIKTQKTQKFFYSPLTSLTKALLLGAPFPKKDFFIKKREGAVEHCFGPDQFSFWQTHDQDFAQTHFFKI